MRFLILGPLAVSGGAGVVELGGIKPRAVLAVLLLHANEPVSAERLALALWGEDAPTGATKTVQVHVSRLRKSLDDADLITTTPAGYCLRVGPDELDATRFDRLVQDGRHAVVEGRSEQAAATLREALAMWRGPPLADLAGEPFARAEVARLEEQQLAALETRVEADLACGRHAELVAELQHLVAANPTRERLSAHLMLALYRCGRQTQALSTYQEARRLLVGEIGIEPGHELRELHEAILRQDLALEPSVDDAALPPELDATTAPALVGREPELARLRRRWERARAGAGGQVLLVGERGAGKTRVAGELAAEAFQRGHRVLYASGAALGAAALDVLSGARGAQGPTLIVLDDADDAIDGEARLGILRTHTRALASDAVLVLLCCRDADAFGALGAECVLRLEALDTEAVRAIGLSYAPSSTPADVPAEWLLEASGGLPRRVHELAGQWARREAARRVGGVASPGASCTSPVVRSSRSVTSGRTSSASRRARRSR